MALREAARYVTQLYDRHLAAAGLPSTQFSILTRLKQLGPTTINALAHALVIDRTTVGRNIQPLQRRRLLVVKRGEGDARRKELHLTTAGLRGRLRWMGQSTGPIRKDGGQGAGLAVARPVARRRRHGFARRTRRTSVTPRSVES